MDISLVSWWQLLCISQIIAIIAHGVPSRDAMITALKLALAVLGTLGISVVFLPLFWCLCTSLKLCKEVCIM